MFVLFIEQKQRTFYTQTIDSIHTAIILNVFIDKAHIFWCVIP